MSGNLFRIVCLVFVLNMQGSLSQDKIKTLEDKIKDKLGVPDNIDRYSENGNHGLTYTLNNGNKVGAHANVDFNNGINVNSVGVHGELDLGNGVKVKGEINKGVGSNDGVSGGVSVSTSLGGGGSSWWRRKRSIACMEQCNHACKRSTDTCVLKCIKNIC